MSDSRGILNPAAQGQRFQLARLSPDERLANFVECYWCVRWELAPDDSYLTETLPFPCVNLVFEPGRSVIQGICTKRWSRVLTGTGRVFGVKFVPGAFSAFFAHPIAQLSDRVLPVSDVFGPAGSQLERELLSHDADAERVRVFEAFLSVQLPAPDPARERVRELVELALATPSLRRVEELTAAAAVSTRTLQRLFRRYLGVSPKWLLCRFRIQEAAQRVVEGEAPDWAALASELGYFDQAHFASDFKAQVGKTPTEYAAFARGHRHDRRA